MSRRVKSGKVNLNFVVTGDVKVARFEKVYKKSKKNNTWYIRRLVDNSFVQSAQRPSLNLS